MKSGNDFFFSFFFFFAAFYDTWYENMKRCIIWPQKVKISTNFSLIICLHVVDSSCTILERFTIGPSLLMIFNSVQKFKEIMNCYSLSHPQKI